MARILLMVLFLFCTLCSSARTREVHVIDTARIKILYKRTMVLDTLLPDRRFKTDNLTLFAGERASAFYSEENRTDLEMQENSEYLLSSFKDLESSKYLAGLEKEAIFRDYNKNKQIVHQRYDLSNWQLNEDIAKPHWEIQDSIINVLGYDCIMATSEYRGRKWFAFFSPEIPIPEGPWKLIGLPGIILKACDEKNEYCYEAISIDTRNPGLVEYYNYRDRLIVKDRIKGLSHRYRVKESNMMDKVRIAYGISNKSAKADTIQNRRYDFEETDYPHK